MTLAERSPKIHTTGEKFHVFYLTKTSPSSISYLDKLAEKVQILNPS